MILRAENWPGEALDELQAVKAALPEVLADRLDRAHARLRNENFPGAAQALTGSALLLQRTAILTLALCEHIRRRR